MSLQTLTRWEREGLVALHPLQNCFVAQLQREVMHQVGGRLFDGVNCADVWVEASLAQDCDLSVDGFLQLRFDDLDCTCVALEGSCQVPL